MSTTRGSPFGTVAWERAGRAEPFVARSSVSELPIDINPLGRGETDDCHLFGLPVRQHARTQLS